VSLQHKEGTFEGSTADYGCKRLLYFEGYDDIRTAIAREKQLKGWRREKKLNLIRDQSRVQRFCTDLGMEDDRSAWKDVPVTIKYAPPEDPVLGLRWPKSLEQHGRDKHRRGPSTPRPKLCVTR
jgi:hypothetical protein